MHSKHLLVSAAFLSQVISSAIFANVSSTGPAYTASSTTNDVYSVNLQNGANSTLLNIPGSTLSDIAILDKHTAYTLGATDGNVYAINLDNNTYRSITPIPLPTSGTNLFSLALADNNTAYVVKGGPSNTIYSVNLQTGAYFPAAVVPGNPGIYDLAMLNSTTAYVASFNNSVYEVNLQTGASSLVATLPSGTHPAGIALADSTTAYVVGTTDNQVHVVNLQTGATSSVTTTIPGNPNLEFIAVSGTTAYTVGTRTPHIFYQINLLDGTFSTLTTLVSGLNGVAILIQMPTEGLSGNNKTFAKYLNANGPINVIREFALLPDGLASALESAAPTRNAFMTYASQNAYLAASQVVSDHARQRRFQHPMVNRAAIASEFSADELLVDASVAVRQNSCCRPKNPCEKQEPYTFYVTPFGEYAIGKSQHATPGFNIGLGGVLAAFELNREDDNVVGFGAAYAYDHVHEDHGAGHANVNQGFLTVYGTLNADQWYFDLGVWGGYYHANNYRKISFPGVKATARSDTHGWQVAPHFEVGYDGFWIENGRLDWFGIEPFLMADWVANWEKGFHEHGAGDLNMGQKGRFCSLIRTETGVRFHQITEYDWGRLVFREKTSYAYQKAFKTGKLTAFLVGAPGTFTVGTLTTAQNLGVGELSMLFIFNNPNAPYVDLRYQGEFGSKYQSHQVMLEIGKDF